MKTIGLYMQSIAMLALLQLDPGAVSGQTNLDSLAKSIEALDGAEKSAGYALLSWEYRFSDRGKALAAGEAGAKYAREIKDTSGIAGNLNSIAETYLNFGEMDKAEEVTKEELPYATAILPNSKYYLGALTRLGTIHYRRGKLDSALHYQLLVQREAEKIRKPDILGVSSLNLGLTYMDLKQHDDALAYFNQSLEAFHQLGFKAGIGACYVNIAETLRAQKKYKEGLAAAFKGEKVLKESGNRLHLGYVYSIMADIYRAQGQKKKFLQYARLCHDIALDLGDEITVAQGLDKLGRANLETGNMEEARALFEESLRISKKINFPTVVLSNYANLRDWHLLKGDFVSADRYEEMFQSGRDSVFNSDMAEKIAEAQTRYETEKKEAEIERQRLELLNQRLWIFGLLAGLLAFALFGYFFYNRYRMRKQAEMDAAVIREQKLGLQAVIEAQENERKRIAGDLHDGIAQELVALRLGFNLLQHKIGKNLPDESERLDGLLAQLDQSCAEVRSIAHTMHPPSLEQHGLVAALEMLLQNAAGTAGLEFRLDNHGFPEDINMKTRTGFYRIAQELLNNIVKHASASMVDLRLEQDANDLVMRIRDNGAGFDFESARKRGTMGVMNILSRAQALGGAFHVSSRPREGTVTEIRIPISAAYD